MDPATLSSLAKIAKPVASVSVSGPARELALPYRVGRKTSKEAKRADIKITAKTVREWLRSDATKSLFTQYSDSALAHAASRLAWTAPGVTADEREANSATVIGMILRNYLKCSSPSDAAGQSFDWLDQRIAAVHAEVSAVADQVVARIDAGTNFAAAARSLGPIRQEQAESLRKQWPPVERAVAAVADSATRKDLLEQWSVYEPDWLVNAPADALAWLGSLAVDADAHDAAVQFLQRALGLGVHPRGFYIARIASMYADSDVKRAREYLAANEDDHPMHVAMARALDQDLAGARDALTHWTPVDREQVAIRGVMLSRALAKLRERNQAIAVAIETSSRTGSGAAALLAAQLLVERAGSRSSVARAADIRQAVDLALRVRKERQAFGSDSAEALEIAIGAILLDGDGERAWKLTQIPPGGDASPREADDPRLRRHAALIAAMTGRNAQAHELAAALDSDYSRAEIGAILAENDADLDTARERWRAAWVHATHDGEKLYSAMALARLGAELPDLTDLQDKHPDPVAEIRLVAEVLTAPDPSVSLRANLYRSRLFVSELARRYLAERKDAQGAQTYADGARHWSDPNLMMVAAATYQSAGMSSEATQCAEQALDLGGPEWSGIIAAIGLIVNVESAQRHWTEAVDAARRLILASPGDPRAEWVLIICQLRASDPDGAWATFTNHGTPLRPQTREEVLAWLQLNTRYATDPGFLDQALEILRDRIDDEQLFGAFLMMAYLPGRRFELTADQLVELHRVTSEYVQRHPDSRTFHTVQLGPDDNPLQFVQDDLRKRYEATRGLYETVARGALPLGMLSSVTSKPYTEASLRRAAGRVLAEDYPRHPEDNVSARRAGAEPAVLDPTAAHTLALVDAPLRTALIGQAHALVTTDVLYHDVIQARDILMLRSTGSIGWDPTTNRPTASEISDQEAERLADLANQIVDIYQNVPRRTHPELKHFPPGESEHFDWLSGLDFAKERGQILWADDRALRHLARSMDVPTFGTAALLDQLVAEEKITAEERDVTIATLLTNYYADVEFDRTIFELAATMESWEPRGAAAALSRPASWADANAAVNFALAAISRCAAKEPEQASGWAWAAAFGLLAVAPDNAEGATRNLEIFLGRCAVEPWFGPHIIPYLIGGIREAQRQSDSTTSHDPLETVLRDLHRLAVRAKGHPTAAAYVLALTSEASEADKALAARIILTAED